MVYHLKINESLFFGLGTILDKLRKQEGSSKHTKNNRSIIFNSRSSVLRFESVDIGEFRCSKESLIHCIIKVVF